MPAPATIFENLMVFNFFEQKYEFHKRQDRGIPKGGFAFPGSRAEVPEGLCLLQIPTGWMEKNLSHAMAHRATTQTSRRLDQ